ncbi:MAG: PKD domain-containing protein, partial [Clostridia bacterium]|nr:PKD domain-containing protein [Clostridia bacterium]
MKRVIAFMIALAVCVGLFVPFATSTNTIAAETLQISVDRTEIASGEALTVSFTGLAASMHNGKDVYSIRVVGGSSKNISDGGKQTVGADGSGEVVFEGLAIGSHTVQLRKWNATSDFTTLQEITVTVKKARPTISVQDTEISVGDTLKVYVNTVGNVHYGDVYSIAISGPSSASKNISDGSKYTYTGESVDFTGLKEGLYSVKLRYWNNNESVVAIQTIEVQATKIRPVISIKDTNLTAGDTLKIYVDASAGNVHYGDAYSIQISGPSTAAKDISNGSKFTYAGETVDFADVKAGSYTVKLRYWNEGESVVTIQTLTVDVGKVRPTISVADRDLTAGDSLTVSVGNTTAVTHDDTEVYSVRIVGGTSVNVSNGSAFTKDLVTFENLKAGTYTIQLRVWSEKTDFTTLQELTITVKDKPLAISVSKETLKAGESITISYEGLSDSLLTDKDVYSIWFGTASGTKLNEWNIWDTNTSMGERNNFTVYVKSAGTYVVRLRVWNAVSGNLDILQEYTITVEKAVQLGGSIQAGKTEYIAGEVQYFSYTFADAADITNIGHRSIKIYNGSTLVFEWTSRNSANSGSSSNEWIDLKNASLAGTPGTYTMKVVIYGTDTAYPGYEDMTYTYTVVERAEGTTPNQPTVTVPRKTLISGEQIAVSFDGMSIANLDYNTRYRVAVRNASGTLLDSWVLWDCGNTYEGLYGVKYSQALPIGNYTVALETRPNSSGDYAAIDTIEILVKKADLAAQPELKESITMHYTVMLGEDVTGIPVMTYVYNGKKIVVDGTFVGNN